MIPSGVEVFIALAPIDLRWGFDRLAGLAQEQVGRSARSGALFVFVGKRKTALKVLFGARQGTPLGSDEPLVTQARLFDRVRSDVWQAEGSRPAAPE
ncbi:MAG: hypothetical protein RL685_2994 [Pseudomonadota bacterium]|jgi:hypothetical protein